MHPFFFRGPSKIRKAFDDIEKKAKLSLVDQKLCLRLKSKFDQNPDSLDATEQHDLMALWNKAW